MHGPQDIEYGVAVGVTHDVLASKTVASVVPMESGLPQKNIRAASEGILDAIALAVSVDTVKGVVRSIVRKLNARGRTHAAALAAQAGLLDPERAIRQ